ncbi:MAG: MFS transporter [Alphaproteobacteria bacterium]|nr:MFS transporter [Alphaproteobacteria bacterium]
MIFSRFTSIARPLQSRNFAWYSLGTAFALTGFWMQRIAVGWLTWQLSESPFWLGVVAGAELFPSVAIGLFAGAAVDRWDMVRVMRWSVTARIIASAALFFLTAADLADVFALVAFNLAFGVIASFNQPARLALIPNIVPRQEAAAALAFDAVLFNGALFAGPVAAGALIAASGVAPTFAITSVAFAVQFVSLVMLRDIPPRPTIDGPRKSLVAETLAGLRYTATHPGIGPLMLIHLASCVFGRAYFEMLAAFADRVFDAGAHGFAVLTSSVGVGAIVGGLWIAQFGVRGGLTRVVFGSAAVQALALFAFAPVDALWVAAPLVGIVGGCVIAGSIATLTLLQLAVEPSLRGRAVAAYGIVYRGGPAVGAVLVGGASEYVGLHWPIAATAAILLAAAFLCWRWRARMTEMLEANLQ